MYNYNYIHIIFKLCTCTVMFYVYMYMYVLYIHLLLYCSGADITALDQDSYTPLLIAAAHGQTDALEKLLDRGAPVDDLDKDGKSVVFVAAEENHTEVLQVRLFAKVCTIIYNHGSWDWERCFGN